MRGNDLPIYWPCVDRDRMPDAQLEELQEGAWKNWDNFYGRHQTNFFKDRHYLDREFPSLLDGPKTILEVGCGVGNSIFPILEANPEARIYACDFSPKAVQCVQEHELYGTGRVTAFVADLTVEDLSWPIPGNSVDICTMVFVLSAIAPEKMRQAVGNLAAVMKVGGLVLFRDYAIGDLVEQRFDRDSSTKRIRQHHFVRGDGTFTYFFSEAELQSLFLECGFACEEMQVLEKDVENRAQGSTMERRWIQGVFKFKTAKEAKQTHTQGLTGDATVKSESSPRKASSETRGINAQVERQAGVPNGSEIKKVQEWEAEEQLHALEDGLGNLFMDELSPSDVQEEFRIRGMPPVCIRSVPREHKHTLAHTGLMLWDASPHFAEFLANAPDLLNNKVVLELGSGGSPLCTLACLRNARRVLSSDGSIEALLKLAANVSLNASQFMIERARLRHLIWGDENHISTIAAEQPGGFDLVIGADVVYVEDCVPSLFHTASKLIKQAPEARVILCHVARRVSEARIVGYAQETGFCQAALPSRQRDVPGICSSIRLLCFGLMDLASSTEAEAALKYSSQA